MRMQIKFEHHSSIDANTLINVLSHYQNIVYMANRELGHGDKEVCVQVNAIQKSSFLVDVSLVQTFLDRLFKPETVAYIADLCVIVGGIFGIYKWKKGRPVQKGEEEDALKQTGLLNIGGNVEKMVVNVYNVPAVREAVSKSFETVNNDAHVDIFSVKTIEDRDPVVFEREEFPNCIYTDFDKEEIPDERVKYDENAILTVTAVNFQSGGTWRFVYNGFPINMTVKEDGLMKAIDTGERFGKGDSIRVKLKIVQRFDKEMNVYVNKSFRIEDYFEHIEVPRQAEMF